jgi:hypothetical protein
MRQLRFYEKDPTVRRAVEALFLFPEDIKRVLSGGFALMAEQDCHMSEVDNRGKTLGAEKILSLHKSKQKKRPYDNCPITHKAMNYLMLMTPESRIYLAEKVIELMGFMQEYLKLCQSYSTLPDEKVVQGITDIYVNKGAAETRVFLGILSSEFKHRLLGTKSPDYHRSGIRNNQSAGPQKGSSMNEAIQAQQSGMRIKADLD